MRICIRAVLSPLDARFQLFEDLMFAILLLKYHTIQNIAYSEKLEDQTRRTLCAEMTEITHKLVVSSEVLPSGDPLKTPIPQVIINNRQYAKFEHICCLGKETPMNYAHVVVHRCQPAWQIVSCSCRADFKHRTFYEYVRSQRTAVTAYK